MNIIERIDIRFMSVDSEPRSMINLTREEWNIIKPVLASAVSPYRNHTTDCRIGFSSEGPMTVGSN